MNHKRVLFIIVFIGVLLTTAISQTSPEYKILFEKAKFTMETKGDLNGAINLFNDIIKKYPKEREYAAKSQLYIGLCYEKLGKTEAARAFQQVVDRYPDQKETVTLARQRLSELSVDKSTPKPQGMTLRKVMDVQQGQTVMAFSSDGRYIALRDQSSVTLIVKDLKTGETWPVSEKGTNEGTPKSPDTGIFSPDSKQLAYMWREGPIMNITELRIVNLDGTGMRIISRRESSKDSVSCPVPVGWSADGKYILGVEVVFENKMPVPKANCVMVSVTDGSRKKILYGSSDRQMTIVRFSPDVKSIVYDGDQTPGTRNKDIYSLTIDGKMETALIEHPANDRSPFYSADGRFLVFMSDRFGSNGLFAVGISDGKPAGDPRLLKSNLEEGIEPYTLTRDGSLIYMTSAFQMDIYMAPLNMAGGISITTPSKLPTRYEGINIKPAWSPDGKYLAYLSLRENNYFQNMVFVIRNLSTGEEYDLTTSLHTVTGMYWFTTEWSPDNRYLLVHARTDSYSETDGFFRIDIKTGKHEMILGESESQNMNFGLFPQYLPDGKSLIYLDSDRKNIIKYDLDKKKGTVVYHADQSIGHISLSHNGEYIAVCQAVNAWDKLNGLVILSLSGNQPVTFAKPVKAGLLRWPEWTPDNKGVIVAVNSDLYLFQVNGGQTSKLDFSNKDLGYIRIHPDGKQVVYDQMIRRSKEVWAIDNFLPK
jgi:Tol biopolymer transport system component